MPVRGKEDKMQGGEGWLGYAMTERGKEYKVRGGGGVLERIKKKKCGGEG